MCRSSLENAVFADPPAQTSLHELFFPQKVKFPTTRIRALGGHSRFHVPHMPRIAFKIQILDLRFRSEWSLPAVAGTPPSDARIPKARVKSPPTSKTVDTMDKTCSILSPASAARTHVSRPSSLAEMDIIDEFRLANWDPRDRGQKDAIRPTVSISNSCFVLVSDFDIPMSNLVASPVHRPFKRATSPHFCAPSATRPPDTCLTLPTTKPWFSRHFPSRVVTSKFTRPNPTARKTYSCNIVLRS
jgi:hypothetical protein